jgi:hypothetical protein
VIQGTDRGLANVSAAPASVALLGILLQFTQSEDPRFPLAYFTVLSALLVAATPVLAVAGLSRCAELAWRSGAAGALVAGAVYWLLLAPTAGVGSQWETVSANVVLHAILPLATVLSASRRHLPARASRSEVLATLWFPGAYLVAVLVGQTLLQQRAPYDFIDVARSGWWVVAASSVIIGLLYLSAALLLLRLQSAAGTSPRSRPDPAP